MLDEWLQSLTSVSIVSFSLQEYQIVLFARYTRPECRSVRDLLTGSAKTVNQFQVGLSASQVQEGRFLNEDHEAPHKIVDFILNAQYVFFCAQTT
jgi:hypothetical protein